MSNFFDTVRNLFETQWGERYPISHPGNPHHPGNSDWMAGRSAHDILHPKKSDSAYHPGDLDSTSVGHASNTMNRKDHAAHIKSIGGEHKKITDRAHALSDKADSLKHTLSNHTQLHAAHSAAGKAHAEAAGHFANMTSSHGGTTNRTDHSGSWDNASHGMGGSYHSYNTAEAHHFGKLQHYHMAAATYHHGKANDAKDIARAHAASMRASVSAKNAEGKKRNLAKAREHEHEFTQKVKGGHGAFSQNLSAHMDKVKSDRGTQDLRGRLARSFGE